MSTDSTSRTRTLPRAAARTIEREAWADGYRHVAGTDEAGRGALAGPVVAAAVIMPEAPHIAHVADSKLLAPEDRERLAARIVRVAVAWSVGIVGPADIDDVNILQATYRAMRLALGGLSPQPDMILVDGWPLPGTGYHQRNVIDGDRLSYAIAAASIIAKVTRDAMMRDLDLEHPQYGFAAHKGYCTRAHLEALDAHGPCPIHRMTFAPCRASGQAALFDVDAGDM